MIDGVDAFSSDGAPSDCVAIALLGFIEEKIDLVVRDDPHGVHYYWILRRIPAWHS